MLVTFNNLFQHYKTYSLPVRSIIDGFAQIYPEFTENKNWRNVVRGRSSANKEFFRVIKKKHEWKLVKHIRKLFTKCYDCKGSGYLLPPID